MEANTARSSFTLLKKIFFFALHLILTACINYDKCYHSDCTYSTQFRFNLVDSFGNDILFNSPSNFKISDIVIRSSSQGKNQYVYEATVSTTKILIVELSGNITQYDLVLKGVKQDSFTVKFRETQEECCGQTFWIDEVNFNSLGTVSPLPNIGSTKILLN